ncbi:hypothetical protein IPC1272_07255 [Pseudomonas aeruginosa]|nr:hypothetical protein AO947_32375 [Pseudomonas aeruginosa]RMJ61371.1 hypothetical protein IPC1272_07255 [Pseudomonas aeruginosa]
MSGRTLAGSLRHRPEDATPVVALPLSFCSAPPVARTSPPGGCPGSFAQPPPGPVRPGLVRESEINQKGKARKLWDIEEGKGI